MNVFCVLWWIGLGHEVHPKLSLVEPSTREVVGTILGGLYVAKGGTDFSSSFSVQDLGVLNGSEFGTLFQEFLLDFVFPSGLGFFVLVVHVVDQQMAGESPFQVTNELGLGRGRCCQLASHHVRRHTGSRFCHRRHCRGRSNNRIHCRCGNRGSRGRKPHGLVQFLFRHGCKCRRICAGSGRSNSPSRRCRRPDDNWRRSRSRGRDAAPSRHLCQNRQGFLGQGRSVQRVLVGGHYGASRRHAGHRLLILVGPSRLEGPTSHQLSGHSPNSQVADLGISKGQKGKSLAHSGGRIGLDVYLVEGSKLRKERVEMFSPHRGIQSSNVNFLRFNESPGLVSEWGQKGRSYGCCRRSQLFGVGHDRTGRSVRQGHRLGSSSSTRTSTRTTNRTSNSSTNGTGTTTTTSSIVIAGGGMDVILFGFRSLDQNRKSLKVGRLVGNPHGLGHVLDAAHFDVGTTLVVPGLASIPQENNIVDLAANGALEIFFQVSLRGSHDQLRHKDRPLVLGKGQLSIVLVSASFGLAFVLFAL
mmetsp:Transcript_12810/g.26978  ORF Transcript_12810/g.26978 Transcript_12810/m.26978 type:complete len:527 (-) Transcript_12810:543-2123(-)